MTEVAVAFAFPRKRRQAKLAAPKHYPARVARQLALAHVLQRRVDRGEFVDHAGMARSLGFTRARMSQPMNLLLLAPDIQEEILFLEAPLGTPGPTEHSLRHVVAALDWDEQRRQWDAAHTSGSTRQRSATDYVRQSGILPACPGPQGEPGPRALALVAPRRG